MLLRDEIENTNIPQILHQFAASRLPEEACGYILRTSDGLAFYGCTNTSETPRDNFTIAATSTAKASKLGEIVAVFHSHTDANYPSFSNSDLKACNKSKLPWLLLKLPEDEFKWLEPNSKLPLLEREWVWGEQDCASLIRDIYAEEGINIPDKDRGELMIDGEYVWNADPNWNDYLNSFEERGFRRLGYGEKLQRLDVLLFNFEAPDGVANHAGVFMEPESNIFYHHMLGRLSERTIYGQGWRGLVIAVLRHKELDK